MKFEYLLFNITVVLGPIISHVNQLVRHLVVWRLALLSSVIVMVPYIVWDALVNGSHWWFNDTYTLGWRVAGLPVEEWLFFLTVPMACLFVWEVLPHSGITSRLKPLVYMRAILYTAMPAGVWVFSGGKQYTGLVLCSIGLVSLIDKWMKTDLFLQRRTYLYLAIVAGLTFVFNSYLTARPVVLYGEAYQLGFRVLTIPIEDFGYGFTLMLFNAIFYEKLKAVRHEK